MRYNFAYRMHKMPNDTFNLGLFVGDRYYCEQPFPFYFIGLTVYLGSFWFDIGIAKWVKCERHRES